MKMRKLYASGLALVMALAMAACGGNAGSDTSADYSEEVAPNYLGTFIKNKQIRRGKGKKRERKPWSQTVYFAVFFYFFILNTIFGLFRTVSACIGHTL